MKKQLLRKVQVESLGMQASGSFAQCYRAGNLVFLQGQAGLTLDGHLVGAGDPAAQTRQALENIKTLMELAGGSLADVVKIVVYVTEREHRQQVYPLIREYFGELQPCSTGIVVKGLAFEEMVVEIDAYGVIDDETPA